MKDKPKEDIYKFLSDKNQIQKLVARTGEMARKEIECTDQYILYYKDGVLVKEDGFGNITPFKQDDDE